MVVKTWGLVPTGLDMQRVQLELRADRGVLFRVSGASHQAMMAATDVMWMSQGGWWRTLAP